MDTDLILVTGIAVLMLSVPAAVSAFAERRAPWTALAVVVVGAGIVAFGCVNHPGGMSVAEVPHAIIRVIARFLP